MLLEQLRLARVDDENTIENITFEGEVLEELDLSSIDFEKVTFKKCRLIQCDFTKSGFYDVVFKDCDISNAKFIDTFWKKGLMHSCKGNGANFSNSHFKWMTIQNGFMDYVNTAQSVWENCKIEETKFEKAFFSEVTFKKTTIVDTNLTGVDFYKTPLKNMDLSTCTIEGIMLSEGLPELQGAKINMFQAADITRMLGVKIV